MPVDSRRLLWTSVKAAVLVAVSVLLIACETVSYYSQAARGQMAIVFGRQDISTLLADDALDSELREKFTIALEIREFAKEQMLLPVGDNYRTYVDIDREHVVWNVFAAAEFSTQAMNWCYPIAGCVSYRGYFSERSAIDYAVKLEQQGFDVYTGGVDAYSTLGWFDDSLLSTVIKRADYQLAGLIFHELAHQLVYLPGDTTFNESFATALEREGLRRWLSSHNQNSTMAFAQQSGVRQQEFVQLVSDYRDRFDALYQQDLSAAEKRLQKVSLQEELRGSYQLLKQQWGGIGAYDEWFGKSLNNAQLSTVSSYNDLVPFFVNLLDEAGNDLGRFYAEVVELSNLDEAARERRIEDARLVE